MRPFRVEWRLVERLVVRRRRRGPRAFRLVVTRVTVDVIDGQLGTPPPCDARTLVLGRAG